MGKTESIEVSPEMAKRFEDFRQKWAQHGESDDKSDATTFLRYLLDVAMTDMPEFFE